MGHGTTCTHLVVGPSLVAQSPGDPPSVTGSQVRFGGSVAALGSCVARIGDAVTVGKLDPVDPPAHAVSVRPSTSAKAAGREVQRPVPRQLHELTFDTSIGPSRAAFQSGRSDASHMTSDGGPLFPRSPSGAAATCEPLLTPHRPQPPGIRRSWRPLRQQPSHVAAAPGPRHAAISTVLGLRSRFFRQIWHPVGFLARANGDIL